LLGELWSIEIVTRWTWRPGMSTPRLRCWTVSSSCVNRAHAPHIALARMSGNFDSPWTGRATDSLAGPPPPRDRKRDTESSRSRLPPLESKRHREYVRHAFGSVPGCSFPICLLVRGRNLLLLLLIESRCRSGATASSLFLWYGFTSSPRLSSPAISALFFEFS
jgi:hypothetical protein